MRKKLRGVCVITDTTIQKKYSHLELAKIAVKGCADIVQFRDKNMSTFVLLETAKKINTICKKNNVLFIVNDRIDIALLSDADGVHLGKGDIPVKEARKLLGEKKIIGATAHSLREAKKAEADGADYLGYGHIFPTSTKLKLTKPKGLKNLSKVCNSVNIPVFAIGGINKTNAESVINAGASGIAVVGSVVKSRNPRKAVNDLKRCIK
jgi:thiamine-phosphate pyrophosphorylase